MTDAAPRLHPALPCDALAGATHASSAGHGVVADALAPPAVALADARRRGGAA